MNLCRLYIDFVWKADFQGQDFKRRRGAESELINTSSKRRKNVSCDEGNYEKEFAIDPCRPVKSLVSVYESTSIGQCERNII